MTQKARKNLFHLASLLSGFIVAVCLFPNGLNFSDFTHTDLKSEFARIKQYEQQLRAYESELREQSIALDSLLNSLQPAKTAKAAKPAAVATEDNGTISRHIVKTAAQIVPEYPTVSIASTIDDLSFQLERFRATPIGAPVEGKLTSGYGSRRSPFSGRVHFHRGLDISVPAHTPVVATADGVVLRSGWKNGYGNVVVIDHGFGFQSMYAHLARLDVHLGERVIRGKQLGTVGMTGRATGPHLHYEIFVNGASTNPRPFVQLAPYVEELKQLPRRQTAALPKDSAREALNG